MANSANNTAPDSTLNEPISPSALLDKQISLVDRTADLAQDQDGRTNLAEGDVSSLDRVLSDPTLARKWTKSSLQQQLGQRKYARYQEDRLVERDQPEQQSEQKGSHRALVKGKVKGLWRKKKLRQVQEEDAVIDILYENQRGLFTLGVPHFSCNSLLNFDPKPWTNAFHHTSPVNITNAQVPDPEWEWAWKSWYVDMSRDVDEDGWEYSLNFKGGFSWHGNHPWFHSFVRRRRWLRKRVRKHSHHGHGKTADQKHMSEAHMFTADYFTIHPSRTRSINDSKAPSLAASSGALQSHINHDEDDDAADREDIQDIATLLKYLRRATIDREKLVIVRTFIQNASEELFYLQDQTPHIMSLLVFQNSRRHLLQMLMEEVSAASAHRDQHLASHSPESTTEKQRIDNLLRAVDVAEEQVKRLEYWSDIRRMVRNGDVHGAVHDSAAWSAQDWQGLDPSGPAGNDVSDAKERGLSQDELMREMNERDELADQKAAELEHEQKGEEKQDEKAVDDVKEVLLTALPESSDEYQTAEEPVSVDKGKGRAL